MKGAKREEAKRVLRAPVFRPQHMVHRTERGDARISMLKCPASAHDSAMGRQ